MNPIPKGPTLPMVKGGWVKRNIIICRDSESRMKQRSEGMLDNVDEENKLSEVACKKAHPHDLSRFPNGRKWNQYKSSKKAN